MAHSRPPLAVASAPAVDGPDASSVSQGLPTFCFRRGDDAVRDVFCGGSAPTIGGLTDLQESLELVPRYGESTVRASEEGLTGSATVVVLSGHSTALSGRVVSPINPRAFVFSQELTMAFQRGVQQVEFAARDRADGRLKFYLITFEQACNDRPEGCLPGDLFTPRVERGWRNVEVADDEDLKNTPRDCRQCHQRGIEAPKLLMRELRSPWTHFFTPVFTARAFTDFPGVTGGDLLVDYIAAKDAESYGGISAQAMRASLPIVLESIVDDPQPLVFDSARIRDERWPPGADGYSREARRSPTWDRAFEAFQRGESLALPFYAGRATDPNKLAHLTEAYRSYASGESPALDLPDLADIYPDDPSVRAEIGLQTVPGVAPAQALIQACGACHNDVLDQEISRARFSIDIGRMDRVALMRAVERMELLPDDEGVMPPLEARQLDPEGRARLIDYLRAPSRSEVDDAMLVQAARLGMAVREEPEP